MYSKEENKMRSLRLVIALLIAVTFSFYAGCGKEKEAGPSLETYHKIHKEVGLDCTSCHKKGKYPARDFMLTRYKLEKSAELGVIPGIIDKYVCLGCHKKDSIGPEWYGDRK